MELTIEIQTRPEKIQELYQTLQSLLIVIRKEEGCLDYRLYRDTEENEFFFISINWRTRANLENYLRSASGSAFLGAIDLLGETAKVRFGRKQNWEGIDALKKIRRLP
jgi:quinol monooxygenase YgiN